MHLGRLSSYKYRQGPAGTVFYAAVLDRLAALPAVASVAVADILPLEGFARSGTVRVDDAAPPTDGSGDAALSAVSPEYFKTLGVPVVRGRPFTSADRADGAPVAIVNAAFARRFLGGGDPVGHRVNAEGA